MPAAAAQGHAVSLTCSEKQQGTGCALDTPLLCPVAVELKASTVASQQSGWLFPQSAISKGL